MFKLVVLSALVAVAMAKPSVLHAGPAAVAYTAPVVVGHQDVVVGHHSVAVPSAVSHQSRTDVHSKPVVQTTYTANHVVAAPVAYAAAPAYHHTYAAHPVVHGAHLAYAAAPAVYSHGLVSHGVVSHGVVGHGVVAAPVAYAY